MAEKLKLANSKKRYGAGRARADEGGSIGGPLGATGKGGGGGGGGHGRHTLADHDDRASGLICMAKYAKSRLTP